MGPAPYPLHPVLIVDDEPEIVRGAQRVLEARGVTNVLGCTDSREVMGLLAEQEVSAVLLDMSMPCVSGEELLAAISGEYPHVPVIIVTGRNEVETAVRCIRAGAFDYLVKPVAASRMTSAVRRALEFRELRDEYRSFRQRVLSGELANPEAFSAIITRNRSMRSLFQYVEAIAPTAKPVLIEGETGVGKELVARAVHELSGRQGQWVAMNVAGLDDNLFSDTLFGHLKGAFTGADQRRGGLVEQAADGTLFLDEIGDLSPASQIKLLRLLQEAQYFPLGADVPKSASPRIVVTTNQDLQALEKAGRFRKDLFYRLQTHRVHVPPLRERPDDLPPLVAHFLEQASAALGKEPPTVPKELFTLLATYAFPGNVRELEAMVYDALSHHTSRMLSMASFKAHIEATRPPAAASPAAIEATASPFALFETLPTLKEAPKLLIAEALNRAKGNQRIAAQLLGITPSGLSKALKRAGSHDAHP